MRSCVVFATARDAAIQCASNAFYTASGLTDEVLRDFQVYKDTWRSILETEAVRVAFGPRPVDEPNEARRDRAIHELEKKGTCVSRVTELHQKGQESLKCHWNGDRGATLKHAMAYLMASRDDVRGAAFVAQAGLFYLPEQILRGVGGCGR